ncbi:hypothetical protein AMELA_G00085400 [Ameiurus melas]|uniref:Uncharacterized protein n=1 Tax=Ameiurus melas TaxID=219545 RepID=A0A7J6AVF8_AMEME|nr:hypothetical protein AMELA_G00085400 [Ameiurus melas]
MPPKKPAGGKIPAKKKTKAKTARPKTAPKKKAKAKAKTVRAKPAAGKKTKTKPVKVNQGPKKGKKVTVQGNKPAPPKKNANPNTVKGVVGPQKRKNPNPAEGQNLAKKKRKAPALKENQGPKKGKKVTVQGNKPAPPKKNANPNTDNMPVPAPTQPSVHFVTIPLGNITVQTSARSDSWQPTGGPMNRFSNDDMFSQRVTNNAAVCAQRDKVDNSQTGSDNIQVTDENQLFLMKNRVKLINSVKNVPEILDRLELSNEKAAIVRAERTDQEKMRKLLERCHGRPDQHQLKIDE